MSAHSFFDGHVWPCLRWGEGWNAWGMTSREFEHVGANSLSLTHRLILFGQFGLTCKKITAVVILALYAPVVKKVDVSKPHTPSPLASTQWRHSHQKETENETDNDST